MLFLIFPFSYLRPSLLPQNYLRIHVFFKKHKFKEHEVQNAETLRNI